MKIHRKLRQLIRDPKQFWDDMLTKRTRETPQLMPKKLEWHYRYTVVSAVYNVAPYLDNFFESLVKQRLDFERNIQLVMVDDGSPDDSAKIIQRWQEHFPHNIVYLRKENGGQASARNFGLQHVGTEWVTFIDPDDTVDLSYFLELDNYLHCNRDLRVQMLSANFLFHFENTGVVSNTHPLRYRFAKGDVNLPVGNIGKHMQLSVNSALFRADLIEQHHIRFDESIRPNFEDAHFVGAYLAEVREGIIGFSSKAKYFYRKRSDQSSTLDTAWSKPDLFGVVLERGCLDLFERYQQRQDEIPVHVQRTVLYHLAWYFRRLIDHPEKVEFLTPEQRKKFLQLLDKIFSGIETRTIMEFELAGVWFMHKVGLLGAFKQSEPIFQIVYIDSYDFEKHQVLLRYFASKIVFEYFSLNGQDVLPSYEKIINHDFLSRNFVQEKYLWINLQDIPIENVLFARIGASNTRISMGGKHYFAGIKVSEIANYFYSKNSAVSQEVKR